MMTLDQHRQAVEQLISDNRIEEARDYCRRMSHPNSRLWLSQINATYPNVSMDSADEEYLEQTDSSPADDAIRVTDMMLYDGEIPETMQAQFMETIDVYQSTDDSESKYGIEESHVQVGQESLLFVMLNDMQINGIPIHNIDPHFSVSAVTLTIWTSMVVGVLALFCLISGQTPLAVVIVLIALGAFYATHVILGDSEKGGDVIVQIKLATFILYQSESYIANMIPYEEMETDPLRFPPSILSTIRIPNYTRAGVIQNLSKVPMILDDHDAAIGILRGTVLGLWAMGVIGFYHRVTRRHFVGMSPTKHTTIVVRVEDMGQEAIMGGVEQEILTVIQDWERAHRFDRFSLFWQPSPTLEDVFKRIGRGSSTMLTHYLMRTTRQAVLRREWASVSDSHLFILNFKAELHADLLADIETLQGISETTQTFYAAIAREIQQTIAKFYTSRWN